MSRSPILLSLGCVFLAASLTAGADKLVDGFQNPPASTQPWCYWYWISDNISKDGLTRDLEAMKRVGIGEALIGNIFLDDVDQGTVKALSEEWWGLVEHAIREGGRIGVNIGMFNCPGWSQSGGPWIKPEQSMRYLVSSETRVQGPAKFDRKLPVPKAPFQDVAVLAFPAPLRDTDRVAAHSPRITCTPAVAGAEKWLDGKLDTATAFPAKAGQGKQPFLIEFELNSPFTARSVSLFPANAPLALQCEVQAAGEDGQFKTVRQFNFDRSNMSINVGPMPQGAVTAAFAPVTAHRFRLRFTQVRHSGALAEIELSGAARLESYVEKQLGKMHPTPLPRWDTYLWPSQTEADQPELMLAPGQVKNLTAELAADGSLRWDAPEGEWIIQRIGMTPTGAKNSPASPEGQGLEVDKMNRAAAQLHFDAFIGQLLERMPARDRQALKHVVADSYEMGSQNWTDGFGSLFRQRYGYDPLPWLPVLSGRIVGSADLSDRFLWDLRRLVADQISYEYVGGLRDACNQHGLKLWLENYGHWGFPGEFLQYGGQADQVSGEFWATGDLGSIELRAASSAAHIYGKPIVSAEAFTSTLNFQSTPWSLKKRGDWALTEGINHWVLHVYIHQPWEDRLPGVNAWFSTEFNRHNTWFDAGRAWIDYYRRCHFLLQQGKPVAEVAYFIGEDTPKMTGIRQPELPTGYNFDYLNAEVIEKRLQVKEGRFVLPDGMSYHLLVLPELDTMRPEVLRKIRDLVEAGGTILGNPPSRSPSYQDYPQCDQQVKQIAAELWGSASGKRPANGESEPSLSPPSKHAISSREFGQGRVFQGTDLKAVLETIQTPPDVTGIDPANILWTHRAAADTDIYFLSNQGEQAETITPTFRVAGRSPELWHPDRGETVKLAVFENTRDGVRVPIQLEARGSVFVVFRESSDRQSAVTRVTRNGEEILSTVAREVGILAGSNPLKATNTFAFALWVKPAADIALPQEAVSGVFLDRARNDVIFPAHGDTLAPGGGHAGAGLAVGRNGVVVYEHAANYFAPPLSHGAALTDWTLVAVVYQHGRPSLYLNGKKAREGLQSRYVVHPSPGRGNSGPAGAFKGGLSELQQFDHVLTETELASLFQAGPPMDPALPFPAIALDRNANGQLTAQVGASGQYRVDQANGTVRSFAVDALPAQPTISGPWEVRFPSGMDAPERMIFDQLISWPDHKNTAVKYFSGTATYIKEFNLPDTLPIGNPQFQLHLDLGQVAAMAEVVVNGRSLGVLWKPAFITDITPAIHAGVNTLELRVTSVWLNRLIGHKKFPEGFPGSGTSQFKPFLTADIWNGLGQELLPSGLLGPVRLHWTQRIPVSRAKNARGSEPQPEQ